MSARNDNRPVVKLRSHEYGNYTRQWSIGDTYWVANLREGTVFMHVSPYPRRASAKRGMLRFLRRIGADPSAVRWEGEE